MSQDIENYVRQCIICQTAKGTKHHKVGQLEPIEANFHGQIVHFDFAGPFFQRLHILIMVDNYSGAVVLHPCYSTSAENVVFALLHHWYPYHGLPMQLITDRGTGFIAHANKILYRALGINKIFTSAYHPQTNAKAERVVQEVKKGLALANITLDESLTSVSDEKKNEIDHTVKQIILLLPAIQFSINQFIHSATQVSPHMLVYGHNLRDIVDFNLAREMLDSLPNDYDNLTKFEIVNQVKAMIDQAKRRKAENYGKYVQRMKDNYDVNKVPHNFSVGDKVMYYVGDLPRTNKKLHRRFIGPCEIIEKLDKRENVFKLKLLGTNKTWSCHAGMLKHYYQEGFVPVVEMKRSEIAKQQAKNRQQSGKPVRHGPRIGPRLKKKIKKKDQQKHKKKKDHGKEKT